MRSELNVGELATCADMLAYADVSAQPDWQALGKRLGKDMGKVRHVHARVVMLGAVVAARVAARLLVHACCS